MSPSAFTRINLAACLAALALLLFLFIYPRMVLTELSDRICAGANELIGMIEAGDWAEANAGINAVNDAFQEKKERLKLFLDHEDLDELDATLMGCRRLIEVQEDKQILFELERVINIAMYLKEIEVFTVYNLFLMHESRPKGDGLFTLKLPSHPKTVLPPQSFLEHFSASIARTSINAGRASEGLRTSIT